MKKGFFLLGILICLITPSLSVFGKTKSAQTIQIEDYIISGNTEQALKLLRSEDTAGIGTYFSSLLELVEKGKDASPKAYYQITSSVQNRESFNAQQLSFYLMDNLSPPVGEAEANMDYCKTVWSNIISLANQNLLDTALIQNQFFEQYVAQFDTSLSSTKKAKVLASNLHVTLAGIQQDVETGVALCLENLKISREIKDTNLIVNSIYNYTNFLIIQGKLDEYISMSEEAHKLDKMQKITSPSYMAVMMNLVDAYLYKGGHEKESIDLLKELYQMDVARLNSYSYMVKFLRYVPIPSSYSDTLFSVLQTTNLKDFCYKTKELCEPHLNNQDYFYLINEIANAFAAHEYYDEALTFKQECIEITRKAYSQDMAEALANNETSLLKQQQELELKSEQQKSQLMVIISILSTVLLILAVVILLQRRKKEKLLEKQNSEIITQRDAIQKKEKEKALLLKEIHHRVKNNFQVISSLLELQSAEIKDEQALQITKEGKTRINSMALIHKKLYQNDDLIMYFDEYLEKLIQDLVATYKKNDQVTLHLDIIHQAFDLDTAIPLGLIVNELITNALKYGTNQDNSQLTVRLKQNETNDYQLIVKDNGPGFPEDLKLSSLTSLGLNLVVGLSKQLNGSLEITNDNGAKFTVLFKDTSSRGLMD